MQNKTYVAVFAAVGIGISMLYSCKQTEAMEAVVPLANTSKARIGADARVTNGFLSFPSLESFNQTMQVLHGKYENAGDLGQWEKAYSDQGYQSLRRQYELIDADTSELRREPTADSLIRAGKLLDCPDEQFASVLSKDGYIQIADTVYSFRPDQRQPHAFAVPERYTKELLAGSDPKNLPGTKVHRIGIDLIQLPQWPDDWHVKDPEKIVIPNLPICQYPSGSMPQWWGQSGGDIFRGNDGWVFPEHNGRQVKLNYGRWRVGFIFYASTGVRLKMLKHTRFAGWLSNTYAEEMIMDACVKGKVFVPGLPLMPFNEQTAPAWPYFARHTENKFEKTLKWTANGFFNEIILDHFNFHFRVNYRGRIVERYIRQ